MSHSFISKISLHYYNIILILYYLVESFSMYLYVYLIGEWSFWSRRFINNRAISDEGTLSVYVLIQVYLCNLNSYRKHQFQQVHTYRIWPNCWFWTFTLSSQQILWRRTEFLDLNHSLTRTGQQPIVVVVSKQCSSCLHSKVFWNTMRNWIGNNNWKWWQKSDIF